MTRMCSKYVAAAQAVCPIVILPNHDARADWGPNPILWRSMNVARTVVTSSRLLSMRLYVKLSRRRGPLSGRKTTDRTEIMSMLNRRYATLLGLQSNRDRYRQLKRHKSWSDNGVMNRYQRYCANVERRESFLGDSVKIVSDCYWWLYNMVQLEGQSNRIPGIRPKGEFPLEDVQVRVLLPCPKSK